ncbi:hypothetical protein SNE40_005679 [Patella caerulea]|uniref:Fe2OG dioxygenase domain-containing protein n=1 Tax=Patella caerulea TaxID=87958 RepID=A0AAN8K4D6_PATCE
MATSKLPVIDLSQCGDQQTRVAVAKKMVDALKTVGFLYIDNIPGFDQKELLKWCRWFFNLPENVRFKLYRKLWNPNSKSVYRGCFPLQKGEISYKEGFEMGQDIATDESIHPFFADPNVWPEVEGADEFKTFMTSFYTCMMRTGRQMCHLLCIGCGLKEDFLDSTFFPDSLSTLRLLHYPVRTEPAPDVARHGNVTVCCSEHSDSGFITLLSTFNFPGLQIKLESGEWIDVPSRPNSLVMNIGDMLSKMTNGNLKATRHRVLEPLDERFSVPFFFEPNYAADVGYVLDSFLSENKTVIDSPDKESRLKYGPWLLKKMMEFTEYRYMIEFFNQQSGDI